MLSILIQLNPDYLLGIREEDPLLSHPRGSRGRAVPEPESASLRGGGVAGSRGYLGAFLPGLGESRAGPGSSWSPRSPQTG